ncbi:hypothetical protein A374_09219 [Fictibacillus macauensis ZFHKF-1]|uniref:Putative amidase domain-containing protein n=1 Tax=Fictibacillus macauensis ZFHKF-1 TaxID=1196324 RepID=I8UGK7_9BACL|nr:amidase domain-containing protein [Fictibacillus macauensis]EIT86005.1 hypothetical protein A374_09219 [Fictibacillus macauensis ZFHKF-1]
MKWKDNLEAYIKQLTDWMVNESWTDSVALPVEERACMTRKKRVLHERNAVLVNTNVEARVLRHEELSDERCQVDYNVHFSHLIKHGFDFYVEEWIQERRAFFQENEMMEDFCLYPEGTLKEATKIEREGKALEGTKGVYDRLAAVRYAETWWNEANPAFRNFDVNCTNYISQCIYAGGIPMAHTNSRSKGWWFTQDNWSYSWTVANAMRWYLSGGEGILQAREVTSAQHLLPGDVICYDFDGDGTWEHTAIVTGKDSAGEPLVNAHSVNCRMRYWRYEDSTAYTPNIKYKFFHLL